MNATFETVEPQDIEFEAKIRMSLAEWNSVRSALDKGKEGYYGPARWVIEAIDQMVRRAETTFTVEGNSP